MRLVYCHACGAVSTNTFGERDVCTKCGSHAERMEFHRPWQYWAGSAILLAAAAFFVWGPIQDVATRAVIFVIVLIPSYALSNWGMSQARKRVLDEVAKRKAAEREAAEGRT